jgi:fructose transport system ATP-binding protein
METNAVPGSSTAVDAPPVLEIRELSKAYGALKAVDSVSFKMRSGEVTALVGDNGAGKSTVVKMISGALIPDSGEILISQVPVHLSDPIAARRLGIETVYQDLAVLPNLDVVTNLYIGREIYRRGIGRFFRVLNRRMMLEEASVLLADLDIKISSLKQAVGSLSGGQRQSVAIGRAFGFASKVLIMDEPTAALGVAESAAVLRLVNQARERGLAVLIISHILPHVIDLADRVVVMRHGRLVGELSREETSQEVLVRLIVGIDGK